ncbi:hypothetical protein N6H14_19465 [Paenibacillus sp. CC-CFT747]|nr:hypothetical protein N6H14_19465 [Paenibacillus sp. CC-CFT747]
MVQIYSIDDDHRFDLRKEQRVEPGEELSWLLPAYSVTLLEWSPSTPARPAGE